MPGRREITPSGVARPQPPTSGDRRGECPCAAQSQPNVWRPAGVASQANGVSPEGRRRFCEPHRDRVRGSHARVEAHRQRPLSEADCPARRGDDAGPEPHHHRCGSYPMKVCARAARRRKGRAGAYRNHPRNRRYRAGQDYSNADQRHRTEDEVWREVLSGRFGAMEVRALIVAP